MPCCAMALCSSRSAFGSLLVPRLWPSSPCDRVDNALTMRAPDLSQVRRVGEREMSLGRCRRTAAKMPPPPFESPHAPAGSRSSALDEREYKADGTSRDRPHGHGLETDFKFRGRNRVAT